MSVIASTPEAAAPASASDSFGGGNHGENNIGLAVGGSFPAQPEQAATSSQQNTQQPATVPSALPAGASPEQFAAMFAQAIKPYLPQQPAPAPVKAKYLDGKHWALPGGEGVDGPAEFAQRFDAAVQEAVSPVMQELQMLRHAVAHLSGTKATDPAFQVVENRVNELMSSGQFGSLQIARQFAEMERKLASGAAGTPAAGPNAPRPVPALPPHSQSPTTRAPGNSVPRFDPKAKPDISNIMNNLLKQGGFIE